MGKEDKKKIKSFLKWAGGKSGVMNEIIPLFPKTGKRYIEPFAGSGVIALNVDFDEIILNDINADLMNVFKFLKDKKDSFIKDCKSMFIPSNNDESIFYELRKEFNETTDIYRKAILFIYLNRHCFNGLCRYNSTGNFNVPFGRYTVPYFPENEMTKVLEVLPKFEMKNLSYKDILDNAGKDDVVYCDPPYLPLSETSAFHSYAVEGFSLKDHIDLATHAFEAKERGATVLISNHYNWYSHQMYVKMFNAKFKTIEVKRTISSKIEHRNSVKEIIAIFN